MTEAERRRLERLESRVKDSVGALNALLADSKQRPGHTVLADLCLRAVESSVADGYPPGGAFEPVSGGGHGNPTPNVVVAREFDTCDTCHGRGDSNDVRDDGALLPCKTCRGSGRRWTDPVADHVEAILRELRALRPGVRRIDFHRHAVLGTSLPLRESTLPQGSCLACSATVTGVGSDRLKRGLDNKCYLALGVWKLTHESSGDPGQDFNKFLIDRKKQLAKKEEEDVQAQIDGLRESKSLPKPSSPERLAEIAERREMLG